MTGLNKTSPNRSITLELPRLRKARRRARRPDPLASPEAVRRILAQLGRQCPGSLPRSERLAVKMLESVRHYEARPVVDETRGRPRRWQREQVAEVAGKLRKILDRKTGGRVSPSSFVSLYLRVLRYPADVADALAEGGINIREATYLARLVPERLGQTPQQARQLRAEILKAHLKTSGAQESLRLRVKAALEELPGGPPRPGNPGRQKADELVRRNPYDARHLFYEELQLLIEAMQQVEPDDLKGKKLGEFLRQIDKLLNMLQRAKEHKRLPVKETKFRGGVSAQKHFMCENK